MNIKHIIFSFKQKIRPGVMAQYRKLQREQYLSEEELTDINWRKRKRILKYAYENVPYYARTFREAGFHPQDIKNEDDWNKIPILTKTQIRGNEKDLVSSVVSKKFLRTVTTGGSTGQPLKVYHDTRFPLEALGWRMLSWWGVKPSDNAAYCWRLIRKNWGSKTLNALIWWPTKRIWFDAAKMTDTSSEEFIKEFNQLKPVFFQGYTGAIDYLAQYILKNKVLVHSPKCVWGTSSPISYAQRENIENAFGAPLYDQYGCSEIFWLAGQCQKKKGLHFFSDVRHIEFVDDNGAVLPPSNTGNVIITDMENYGFPLIRYQNGDRGSFLAEKCTCGVNLPLIAPIKGRMTDLVKFPNGGVIAGDYITTLFDDYTDCIRSFQLRQASDYSIKICIVPGGNILDVNEAVSQVNKKIRSCTDDRVDISIEYVDEIQSDRGKTRYVISEIV